MLAEGDRQNKTNLGEDDLCIIRIISDLLNKPGPAINLVILNVKKNP